MPQRSFRRAEFNFLVNNVSDRADSAIRALQKFPSYTIPRNFSITKNGETSTFRRNVFDTRWDETVGSYIAYQQNIDFTTCLACAYAIPGMVRFLTEYFHRFKALASVQIEMYMSTKVIDEIADAYNTMLEYMGNSPSDALSRIFTGFTGKTDSHRDIEIQTTRRVFKPTDDIIVQDKTLYFTKSPTIVDTNNSVLGYLYDDHETPRTEYSFIRQSLPIGNSIPTGTQYYVIEDYEYLSMNDIKYDETPRKQGAAFSYNELGYAYNADTLSNPNRTKDVYSLMDAWRRVDYRSSIYVMEQFIHYMDYYPSWKKLRDKALSREIASLNSPELENLEKVQAIYNRVIYLRNIAPYCIYNVIDIAKHLECIIPVSMTRIRP